MSGEAQSEPATCGTRRYCCGMPAVRIRSKSPHSPATRRFRPCSTARPPLPAAGPRPPRRDGTTPPATTQRRLSCRWRDGTHPRLPRPPPTGPATGSNHPVAIAFGCRTVASGEESDAGQMARQDVNERRREDGREEPRTVSRHRREEADQTAERPNAPRNRQGRSRGGDQAEVTLHTF